MKTKLLFIIIILCLGACNSSEPTPSKTVSVLFDITDPLIAHPDASELYKLLDADNTNQNLHIRYGEISEVDFNPVSELIRPASKTGLLSNAVEEKQRMRGFGKDLEALLVRTDSLTPQDNSSIFLPIISEVKVLQSMDSTMDKTLIIYSNLMENNSLVSYYRYNDLWLLEHQPEVLLEKYLLKAKGINPSDSLRILFIYIPENDKANTQYQNLQQLYRMVFDRLGIPISFSANLTKAQKSL
ncbi:MAG: hypothetical protein EVB11_13115 [Winogradskyella sp.]|nr:MAG: hypothetical protein EVB11_13115 [Winogradskyella sp.]